MTINKIEANQNIFGKLSDFSSKFSNRIINYNASLRFFIETDEDEREWLQKVKIKHQKNISNKIKFAFLEYGEKLYYVIVGIDINHRNDEAFKKLEQFGLKETEINAGIFTNLVFTLDISIAEQANPLEIIETIFTEEEPRSETNYSYNLKKVEHFFDNLFFFEIDMDCTFINKRTETDLIKTILFTMSILNSIQTLKFNDKVIELYVRLCAEEELGQFYENLLYSKERYS